MEHRPTITKQMTTLQYTVFYTVSDTNESIFKNVFPMLLVFQ